MAVEALREGRVADKRLELPEYMSAKAARMKSSSARPFVYCIRLDGS